MNKNLIRTILNTMFLVGALATIVIFFIKGEGTLFYGVGITSLMIKIAEYIFRFFL